MLIKRPDDIRPSEITPERLYVNRRDFMRGSALTIGALATPTLFPSSAHALAMDSDVTGMKYPEVMETAYGGEEKLTPYKDITRYNNFYEFGTGKRDPARNAGQFNPTPWKVTVSGHCEKPGEYALEDIVKPHKLEERIYRLRCVEAWSMVVPWVGIPLASIVKELKPLSNAKYVGFKTVVRPKEMPGQSSRVLSWPYVEGLRMDEAMNPLTLMAVGLYGAEMPNQNGAPIRLVVPWKYGFKSIKSIDSIFFSEKEPPATWNIQAPSEYGFYSNVNPKVDHPRWSQKKERRIGDLFKRETLMFNGYAEQVAQMYSEMDLEKNF